MTTEQQQPTPKTNAPRFEIALILIFFICFIMWSISRCNTKRAEMRADEIIENSEDLITEQNTATGLTRDGTNEVASPATDENTSPKPATTPTPVAPPKPKPQAFGTTLYITIDNLNMRTHPHLDSTVVAKLPLFESVTFLDEVTDFKQQINLGKEMANEPWVKVQTRKGKAGWVYGAGVHYYKIKREGVQ